MNLPIGLVAYYSICKATQETNARAKADTATKVLQIRQIAIVLYTSDGSYHGTLKDQVL